MVRAHLRLKFMGQCLAVGGLALLSACGGGGGGGDGSEPQAAPQSVAASHGIIESRSSAAGAMTAKVRVVNLDTGTLVRSYDIAGSADYPSAEWLSLNQYTVDADGLGLTQVKVSQLAIVQGGKVLLLDLTAAPLGAEKQLSSTADACTLTQSSQLDASGKHAWLRITTKGPDGDCANSADNRVVLVSTDMGSADAAIASGTSSGKHVVAGLSDATGLVQGLLIMDRNVPELAVYSNDLKTRLYGVPVPAAHALAASDAARQLAPSPTSARQGLVQVGSALYLADWTGASLTLGNALTSGLLHPQAGSTAPVAIRSTDRFYVGDGTRVLAIDSSTGQVLADVAMAHPEFGEIVEAATVSNGLVVNQTLASASISVPRSTLTTLEISLTPAVAVKQTRLAGSGTDTKYHVQSVQDDTVYFSEPDEDTSNGLQSLYTINAIGGLPTITPINNVFGIGVVDQLQNPHRRPGSHPVEQLLLCTPPTTAGGAPIGGCAASTLSSYDTVTGAQIELGTFAEGTGLISAMLWGTPQSWTARNNLVQLLRVTAPGTYSSEIWLVNPAQVKSLKQVAVP